MLPWLALLVPIALSAWKNSYLSFKAQFKCLLKSFVQQNWESPKCQALF